MSSLVKCVVQGCFHMVDRDTGEDTCDKCKAANGGMYSPHVKKEVKDGQKEEGKV